MQIKCAGLWRGGLALAALASGAILLSEPIPAGRAANATVNKAAGQAGALPNTPDPTTGGINTRLDPVESAVVDPTPISLNQRDTNPQVDATVKLRVAPARVGGAVEIKGPADLISGVTVTVVNLGDPIVGQGADGKPTGEVRQRIRLTFQNVPPRFESTNIPLTVTYGNLRRVADLTAFNVQAPPSGAAFDLTASSNQPWSKEQLIQLNLKASGADLAGVTMTAGPFEDSRHNPLNASFCMVEREDGDCVERLTVPANTSRTIWLKPSSSDAEPGIYTGKISLTALNGLSAGQSISLTVTAVHWYYWGLALLLLGTVLSFLLIRYLPYQRERDLELRPVLMLRWRLRELDARVAMIGAGHTVHVRNKIAEVAQALDISALEWEGLLSGRFPTAEAAQNEALKARLDDLAKRVAAIGQIVDGVLRTEDDAKRATIDALAAEATFPQTDLATKIETVIGRPRTRSLQADLAQPDADPRKQLAAIVRREQTRNMVTFAVSAITSVMLGYTLVIANDPAFGGWEKLLTAFLWGLGVTSGGTKLTEVTTGTVQTALQARQRG